jgi:multisubunit Na+/H+ antiporter MnhF subunit
MKLIKLTKVLGITSVSLFLMTLAFRFLIYRHLYIGPDSPYGISDVIEFLLGWLLIVMLIASFCVALILIIKGPKVNKIASVWLLGTVSAIVLLVRPLHDLAVK